jgi:hypothetical protein
VPIVDTGHKPVNGVRLDRGVYPRTVAAVYNAAEPRVPIVEAEPKLARAVAD